MRGEGTEVARNDDLDEDLDIVPATKDVEVESWEEEGHKVGNADKRHEPVRRKGVGVLQGEGQLMLLTLVLLKFSP